MFEVKEQELIEKYEAITREKIEDAVNKLNDDRARERKELLRQQKAEIDLMKKKLSEDTDVGYIITLNIKFLLIFF